MAPTPEVGLEKATPALPSSSSLAEQATQETKSIETKALSAPGGDIATDPGIVASMTVPPAVPNEAQPISVAPTPQQDIEAEEVVISRSSHHYQQADST